MSARTPMDREEFHHSRTDEIARKVLTERQYTVWVMTYRDRDRAGSIALSLHCSRVTVERDLAAARKRLREELEHIQEGNDPFALTIQRGHESETVPDRTPAAVARKLEREIRREGRMKAA